MAEFKLGRIRFVWQGDWAASTTYVADDVVSFGGKSYICIQNHTASAEFNTDFQDAIPKWDIVSDGTSWKGTWEPEVEYAPGDVVKYGANVYICEDGHTSATFEAPDYLGLEENLDHWTEFATSFDWKGSWAVNTRYKINDLVRYGGYVYVCSTAHVSATTTILGLEDDQSNWTLFSDGIVYTGEWVTATRYRINDLVKYGGNVWISTSAHTSSDFELDSANWESFVEGFQFEDSWNSVANYQIGDTVTYGGYVYVAKTNNTNSQPTTNPADWDVFTTGFKFQGDWGVLTSYKVGDVVRLGGNTYVAILDGVGNEPPNNTYWSLLNSGINWTYSTQTYLQTLGTNVSSSGSSARFDVVKSNTVYTVSIATGYAGTGYAANDIIKIPGSNIGGTTPANDLFITVTTVSSGAITGITWSGYSSTWKVTTAYHVGDVVVYGANSYICVTKHTSTTGNRPDADLTATYWNLLTLGAEELALTESGDIVYYGETGPTRLPIGVDGQILRVTDGEPSWANWGLIDNVVYVGPLGTDEPAPASGLTIDKPWASVRYALDQVRDGYLNPQAKHLLRNNKEFMMKEVTNWISYTYRVIITAATSGTQVFTTASTANLAVGMPISFNGTLGGVTAGTIYYVDAVVSDTTFRISTIQNSGVPLTLTSGTGQMQGDLAYDAAFCERDTGYIVDALIYDISHGGTLKTVTAANRYYTQAGNAYINSAFGSQKYQTAAANEYLKTLATQILNNEIAVNYQYLNGVPAEDRAVQIFDTSLTAETVAVTKAGTLMDIVITGISAGSATAIPTPTNPNTTVFLKTGTYNEVLPMIVPEYTAVVGDELRTSVVQPKPAIPLLANDKEKTTGVLNRIKEIVPDLMQNIKITPSASNAVPQQFINGYGGETTATNSISSNIKLVQNILENGIDVAEAYAFTNTIPTSGTSNASDSGYANAVNELTANKAFIQAEITAWIADQVTNNTAPFTTAFTYDAVACERDVGYIVDALIYDLTYGGNLETTVAARSYFVDGLPVYGVNEKDEVLAANARLKTVVSEVILETTVTTSTGNTESQVIISSPGSAGAAADAEALVQEIYDTLDTDGTLANESLPDTSWVDTRLVSINDAINTAKTSIQESVIDYINSNYGSFTYNAALCRRDSAILKEGAAYDFALETNYNAVRNGIAYRRKMTAEVLASQLTETLGAITEEGSLVGALMSDTSAISRNTAYWAEVVDIIQNNTPDAIAWGNPGVTDKTTARSELQANRATIISDLTTWIAANYTTFEYDVAVCERDTGYLIDALSYDIQYGGNSATYEAARAYFTGYIEVLPVNQRAVEVASLEQLSTIAQGYMSGATEQAELDALLQVIINVLNSGTESALPAKTYPSYAWTSAPIQADATAVISDTTVVPAVLQYITDTYNDFQYDHAKCSRDIGYIIDALRYDMMFESDFRSLKAGMAYRRGLTSTGVVIDNQLEATLGSISYLRTQIRNITTGTADLLTNIELMKDIIVLGLSAVPGTFTITDPTDLDSGFFEARRLIVANKQFLIDEVEAYMADNYSSLWTSIAGAGQTACLRDMGYIIDALQYDLTYRGNLETVVAARSYYSNGLFVEPSNEKAAALAVQDRLAEIIGYIATKDTSSWTKSVSNSSTQVVSGTAGSAGAAAFATDRINEIRSTIDTGDSPEIIEPSIDWTDDAFQTLKSVIDDRRALIQSGATNFINFMYPELVYNEETCARDVGYIIDALAYDLVFGSNFRTAKAAMSYHRALTSTGVVLADQLEPTISTVEFVEEALRQITVGVESKVNTTAAANFAADRAEDVKNIIQNGLAATPGIVFTTPLGYNTAVLTDTAYAVTGNTAGSSATYGYAVDQIVDNYNYIKNEIDYWLQDSGNGYDTLWGSLSAAAKAACLRDVGYILDAIRYDMTYGGNTQSLIVGSAYYSNYQLTIGANELAATLAAFGRLKTVVGSIILESAVVNSTGNVLVQNTSGTPGNSYAALFAQDRIDDVIDWINNGLPNDTIEIATEWAADEVTQAYNNIVARRSEIVEDVVYWVEKFHQELSYNQDLCRRDAGIIVDAIARDTITGSNFASTKAGASYYRGLTSTAEVINNELEATIGSMNFLKHKIKHIAASSAAARAELVINDITATINGGAKPILKWKSTSATDANDVAGASIIWENKAFIQAEIYEFISQEYPSIEYSREKCLRDVGFIVDALRYDLTYGGNFATKQVALTYYLNSVLQIDNNDLTATANSYEWLKFLASELATNQLSSPGALQAKVTPKFRDELNQTVGDAGTQARIISLMDNVKNIVQSGTSVDDTITITDIASNVITTSAAHGLKIGDEIISGDSVNTIGAGVIYYVVSVPSSTEITISQYFNGSALVLTDETGVSYAMTVNTYNPDISGVNSTIKQQATNVLGSVNAIKARIEAFIADSYPTLEYDVNSCLRDVGYIVDAVAWDMMVESNYRTVIAAISYYRGTQASRTLSTEKEATVQSYRELKNAIATYVANSDVAKKRVNNLMDIIINIVDKGDGDTPEITGTVTYNNDIETIKGVDILKANKIFLANEATAWVTQNYGGIVSSTSGGPGEFTFDAPHNFVVGDPVVFSGTIIGSVTAGATYFVSSVTSPTVITVSSTLGGTNTPILDGTGSMTCRYQFDVESCQRDANRYVDALVYDLQYPGNHWAWRAAELYLNAVNGSQRSDMYRVRNSTGVRNQTLNGLRGNLTELNEFGTRRPTAGAFVALDPGFGPMDSEAWITNKSPYTQNVTDFGVGCTGCKIDGALHAGGNRSMVANDFTQVLSDGIGVWCSGNNSLTELVSVFCYYNYSGYLADFGGRIRATNGNSSYGTWGTIAEGTDTGEVPLYANVDNHSTDAFVGEVLTDGSGVLALTYKNAGRNYTNAQFAISGDGFNATVIADEFRDGGVFESRLVDLDDTNGVGGADYVTAKNVAQVSTDPTYITIANTDTALANAYNGMNIIITAGTGVGQYARILAYNNGTKVAKVYKPSFDNLTVTATSSTGNVLTVADTYSLYVNMPIYLDADVGGLTANTAYYVTAIPSSTTFTVSTSEGGADETLTNASGQTITLYAAGWDHVVPGTAIETGLDLTSGYTIEPSVTFDNPGFTATSTTSSGSVGYSSAAYAGGRFVALQNGGNGTTYSTDGTTWSTGGNLSASANWVDVAFGGGQGASAYAVVGGLGGSGAILEAELGELNSIGLPGPTQIKQINVINGGQGYTSPPTITITPTSGGSGATAICTVLNGVIQDVIVTTTGAGYGAVPTVTAETDKITKIVVESYGNGYKSAPTVTLTGGGASTQATVVPTMDNEGVQAINIDEDINGNILNGAGYTSVPTVSIVDPNAQFVAIANGSTSNAHLDIDADPSTNWTAGTALPNSNFTSIAYGDGVFVAVGGTGGSGGAATSTDGSSWVSRTITTLSAGTYSSIAYGSGTYVAINSGGNQTSTSTNGIAWAAGGNLPASAVWSSVAYGNGRFVAIASGSRSVAYSLDEGVTWSSSPAGLPSAADWNTVKYAQGLFVAVAEGTDACAVSQDGVYWIEHTLPAAADWDALVFGNPNSTPTWAALTNAANNTAVSIKTGARAIGRVEEADGELVSTTILEPGSGYPKGTVVSTTASNTITVDSTARLVLNQPIKFSSITDAGLVDEKTYYINTIPNSTTITVSLIAGTGTPVVVETATLSGATFRTGPITTIIDPNATIDAPIDPRTGDGVVANPTFTNRGTGYQTASAEGSGDGFADLFQASTFVAVSGLFDIPEPGSNVVFEGISDTWYKLVAISGIIGDDGDYTATFQISPGLDVLSAPLHGALITTTNKYSQVRLTGHDFLYIGTGNQADTNYPYVDITTALQERQQLSSGGGRVFFTSTDQDGNFNVGNLFGVQQSTGTATLDADAFNLAGLQSLQLNGIGLGIGSAIITQFSTDPFFTANSDSIVPTQRAIKSYITAQIGGGQSSLNVNTLTAGVVFIANDEITTTNGGQLNITAKMNFTGGVDGAPVALGFFLAR